MSGLETKEPTAAELYTFARALLREQIEIVGGQCLPPQARTGQAKATQLSYLTAKPVLSVIGRHDLDLLNEMFAPELKAIRAREA